MCIQGSRLAGARGGFAVALALATLLSACFVPDACAGDEPPVGPQANHYLVYRNLAPIAGPHAVALRDQFSSPLFTSHVADPLEWFMTPAIKNGEPMVDAMLHYTWWRITNEPFSRRVVAINQFGEQDLEVLRAEYLLNPSIRIVTAGVEAGKRNVVAGGPQPPPANHYKCYRVTGTFTPRPVTVQDQYGFYAGQVVAPEWLCTPAEKVFEGVTDPILQPDLHYVCYRVTLTPPATPQPILFADQFRTTETAIGETTWLCVPSSKQIVTGTVPSTWGTMKAMYR